MADLGSLRLNLRWKDVGFGIDCDFQELSQAMRMFWKNGNVLGIIPVWLLAFLFPCMSSVL